MRSPPGPPIIRPPAATRHYLHLNETVFRWCLRSMLGEVHGRNLENALKWALLAARSALHHGFGILASPELEAAIRIVAQEIPVPHPHARNAETKDKRWLHVLDQGYSLGGHTALVERWIRFDPTESAHSVMLLSQSREPPERLVAAVSRKKGSLYRLPPGASLLEKAQSLRRVAWADADIVVLHAHPYSVIPVAAFGVAGGPPVLLLNHLSQQFWIGGSIADLVICLRPSAVDWARQYRGIDRTFMLPIPISARDTERSQNSPGSPGQSLRARLGIPRDAIVFLTVGNAYKYLALPHLDFLEAAKMIVQRLPEAHLIAIGPRSDDARWRKARESAGDRLHVPGPTSDLSEYHAAADIYLEGFPIGSPTALFEALEQDVACVRAPETVPPPFAADGIALTALDQPKDVAAFVDRAVDLARDDSARIRLGAMLGEETRANHSEAGWRRHYLELLTHLPEEHRIYPDQHIHTLGPNALYLATAVSIAHHRRGTFTYTHAAATKSNLNPKLDSLLTRRVLFHGAVSDLRPLLYLLKRSLSLGHRGAPT